MRFGYACLNNTLAEKDITVNRSMMKKTFQSRGLSYASELALKNVTDLGKVVEWNAQYKMQFYRMSSDMFPWMSEYEFQDLPDFMAIKERLSYIGRFANKVGMRLTFHPGPFNVLASNNPNVLRNTLKELRQHGEIMDLIGLPRSPFAKINIHIGASYGDKNASLKRFCENFQLLDPSAAARLSVENDDKANMFSVADLMLVHENTRLPIVFDYLHHRFCSGGLSEEEAFKLAVSTWSPEITPVVHYSSPRRQYEDASAVEAAHADFIYEPVETYGVDVDVMFEAKAKELAVKKYRAKFSKPTLAY